MSKITERANATIRNHTGFAMAAAVVPIPFADVGAITAVEIDMLRSLTKIYGLTWSENLGKQAVGTAAAVMIGTGIWGSVVKFIPGLGSVVGGLIQMSIAGSVCYALGIAYKTHLDTGGDVFDKTKFEKDIKDHLSEGKNYANSIKHDVKNGKYDDK
jgi:uncharacterized protein (DUF697 family)